MIESGLYQLLTTNSNVMTVAPGGILPLILSESPTYPAVTYQVISSVPQYTLSGNLGLARTRIEYNAWSDQYSTAKAADAAIRAVLDSFVGTLPDGTFVSNVQVINVTDMFEPDARIYRVQTEYMVWHSI